MCVACNTCGHRPQYKRRRLWIQSAFALQYSTQILKIVGLLFSSFLRCRQGRDICLEKLNVGLRDLVVYLQQQLLWLHNNMCTHNPCKSGSRLLKMEYVNSMPELLSEQLFWKYPQSTNHLFANQKLNYSYLQRSSCWNLEEASQTIECGPSLDGCCSWRKLLFDLFGCCFHLLLFVVLRKKVKLNVAPNSTYRPSFTRIITIQLTIY